MADLLSAIVIPVRAFPPFVLGIYLANLYWALCPHFSLWILFNPHNNSFSRSVVLSRQWFCTPGDIWRCLETLVVVIAGVRGANGIWSVKTRDAAQHPSVHKAGPPNRELSGLSVSCAAVGPFHHRRYSFSHLPVRTLWLRVVMRFSGVTQLISGGAVRAWALTTVLDGLLASPSALILCCWAPSLPLLQAIYLSQWQSIVITLIGNNTNVCFGGSCLL